MVRRTVFLPLDKMNSRSVRDISQMLVTLLTLHLLLRCISNQELATARKLVGKDNVHRAIDLVNHILSLNAEYRSI